MSAPAASALQIMPSRAMRSVVPWVLAAFVMLTMPLLFSSPVAVTVMNQMGISIIFALSYNMLLGQGGMLSFGHAVYFGLGGFFAMHMINAVEAYGWYLPLPLQPILAGAFGLTCAALIGAFSTRRAGTVFAMISLGVGELLAACSIIFVVFFGGEEGISGDRTMGPPAFGVEFLADIEVYYLIAFFVLFTTLLMYLFSRTPVGRMANAVRDNEERAEFIGYSQRAVRYISFCGAGFFAGVAGGLFAINYEILTEENLNLTTSGSVLLMAYIGGVGFFVGPIVGAILLTLLQTVLSNYTEIWQLYVGLLFVLTVMYIPTGVTGLLMMHTVPWQLGSLRRLFGPYLRAGVPLLIFLGGIVALLEMSHHLNAAAVGESQMSIFGFEFDLHNAAPWLVAASTVCVGGFLLRTALPAVRDVWESIGEMAKQ